jgi:hypothetical protein
MVVAVGKKVAEIQKFGETAKILHSLKAEGLGILTVLLAKFVVI